MNFQLLRLQDTLVQTNDCLELLLAESGGVVHRGERISQTEDAALHNVLVEKVLCVRKRTRRHFVQNGKNDRDDSTRQENIPALFIATQVAKAPHHDLDVVLVFRTLQL